MLTVAGGTFSRGAQSSDPEKPGYDPLASDDEAPPRKITVSKFEMHVFEVLVWQYENCVEAGACKLKDITKSGHFYNFRWPKPTHRRLEPSMMTAGDRLLHKAEENLKPTSNETASQIAKDMTRIRRETHNHPVNGISWFGARDYCAWVNARLPTEAEWEFAARGEGSQRFPWGGQLPTKKLAIYGETRRESATTEAPQTPGSGPYAHEHLAGNVWEWTADRYSATYYADAPSQDPKGPDAGVTRVIRGGGWADLEASDLRAAFRASMPPNMRSHDIGFRCVRSIAP